MSIKFEQLLCIYTNNIEHAKRMLSIDTMSTRKTKDFWNGYIHSNLIWFHNMKLYCDDYNPTVRKATFLEKKKFKYIEKNVVTISAEGKKIEDFEWPLIGILEYRGIKVPVYDDDAGQQEFIRYKGKTCGGGSFNMFSEYEFCNWLDEQLDLPQQEED